VVVNHEFVLKDKGVSNTVESLQLPRYRWYSYKEGFAPSLVEHAIQNFKMFDKEHDLIIDPFNGRGTVTLFSSLNGYNASGHEVNPFSAFISKVKETSLSQKEIMELQFEKDRLISHCKKAKKSPLLKFSTFSESDEKEKWLFNSSVLNSFESGHSYIKSLGNYKIKSLLKLCLIHSAMDNCNAKKDGKCLRYKNSWETLNFDYSSFILSIEKNLNTYLEDIDKSRIQTKSKILLGDSRKLLQKQDSKFKLCITSPPYLNSFDYTDIYRPELFLGEFVTSQKQLFNLRFKTLRSHINHKNSFDDKKTFGLTYESTIQSLVKANSPLWHNRIPSMIQSYFEDMKNVFLHLRKQADENAQLWIIVGNSAYADLEIPTDLILAEIGTKANWFLKEIGVLRHLHKRGTKYSPNISLLRESVIIFSASA
jgi:hypothetical protein